MSMRVRWIIGLLAAAVLICATVAFISMRSRPRGGDELIVYVPCGMELPFMAAARAFQEADGTRVRVALDNPDILVKRIMEKGERPDVVITPGLVEMQRLVKGGHVREGDIAHFGRYELVLFGPRDNPGDVSDFEDLLKPSVKTIAIADPEKNSVGRYTLETLRALNLWEKVEPKVVYADHPITAYTQVATGKSEASFAYRSCPLQSAPGKLEYSRIRIFKSVPMDIYGPAYAALGILEGTPEREAADRFRDFLLSPEGQKLLAENGVPNIEGPASGRVELKILIPCGMISAFYRIKSIYEAENPNVSLVLQFDRADIQTRQILEGQVKPDIHISIGHLETEQLIEAGLVARDNTVPFGRFRLAMAVNSSRKDDLRSLDDLAGPEARRILLTRPEHSSVGLYAVTAMKRRGVWEKVEPKVEYMPNIKDCYAALAAGGADATFGYIGCPITLDEKKAEYSKVLPAETLDESEYGEAIAIASALSSSANREEAMKFARFLASPEAIEATGRIGLSPVKHSKE